MDTNQVVQVTTVVNTAIIIEMGMLEDGMLQLMQIVMDNNHLFSTTSVLTSTKSGSRPANGGNNINGNNNIINQQQSQQEQSDNGNSGNGGNGNNRGQLPQCKAFCTGVQ